MSTTAEQIIPPAADQAVTDEAVDKSLETLFGAVEGSEKPATATPVEVAEVIPAAAPVAPAPKAEEEEDKPIRRRRRAEPAAPAPAPAPVAALPVAKAPEPDDEDDLVDEEKDQLQYARDAERLMGGKFRGQEAKVKAFFKAHTAYLEAATAKDADVTFDADNAEYQAWLTKNNPTISPRDVREIERARAVDEAGRATDTKLAEVRDEVFRRDEIPKVKAEGDRFFTELTDVALPADLKAVLREKGSAEAKKQFPIEFAIANEVMGQAAGDIEEFIAITRVNPTTGRPLKAYDAANPVHGRLLEFVNSQCDAFERTGGKLRINKEGKTFATRTKFFSVPPEQRADLWTFQHKDIIAMAKVAAQAVIKDRISVEYKTREDQGWQRPKAAVPVAPPSAGAPPPPRPGQIPAAPLDAGEDMNSALDILMGKAE